MKSNEQETKKVPAPRLRFKQFEGLGEWEEQVITPYLREYSEKVGFDTEMPIYSSTRTGLKKQKDYFDGKELENDGSYRIVPDGYIVYRHMSDDGLFKFNINRLGFDIAVSKEYPVFTTDGIDTEFLVNKLNFSSEFEKFALEQKKGGTRTRLYFRTLATWKTLLPSLPEQTHIAACLSSLDAVIDAHTDKLDALRQHKRALMQQLFPQEGEKVPRLRFPEFEGTGEWEISTIGENALKVGSGITPSGGDSNYKTSGRPFVRSQNVGWGELITEDMAHVDEKTHASFAATELKFSDVLLNITGASIGRAAIVNEKVIGGNVNQHVCIIRAEPEKLLPKFLLQFLLSKGGQDQIDSFQAGGNRQGLNFAQIRSFKLPLPTLPEQTHIAACLSSLDDLIKAQSEKIDELKTFKRGLMQGLFPRGGEE